MYQTSLRVLGQYLALPGGPNECVEGYWFEYRKSWREWRGLPSAPPKLEADNGEIFRIIGILLIPDLEAEDPVNEATDYRYLYARYPGPLWDIWKGIQDRGSSPRASRYRMVEACGSYQTTETGETYLLLDSLEPVLPLEDRPPEPITIEGAVTRYYPPGIAAVWPMVDGYILSSSIRYDVGTDEAYRLNQLWNSGKLTEGTILFVHGYPTDSTPPKLVPVSWRILKAGPPPEESPKHPWDVKLPNDPSEVPGPIPKDNGAGEAPGEAPGALLAGLGGAEGLLVLSLLLAPFVLKRRG